MAQPLDAELDALFSAPLAEFTAARNRLAARLKQEGATAEAARVAALEKPSAAAWAVNQLHFRERAELDRLFAAAAKLQHAQRAGGPDLFREAQRERREALAGLVRRAAARLTEAGHAATPATLTRVSSTLEALAGRGGAAEAVPLGRLSADLEAPGFDAFAGALITPPSPEQRRLAEEPAPTRQAAEAEARRKAIETARQAVADADGEVRRRRKTVAALSAKADEARRAQKDGERLLSEAAQAARAATETAEKAGFEARGAQTALAEAERALESARAVLDRTKRLP
jgi:hypothetical protein